MVGPLLFHYDLLVYLSLLLCALIAWMLRSTRAGLRLRAVGESPEMAHALGEPVTRIRYLAVLFGGAMSGIAGAYLSTALTPMWTEGMSAGRGWIALALVVFGTWKPLRVVGGAYLFGTVTVLQLYAQGLGVHVPSAVSYTHLDVYKRQASNGKARRSRFAIPRRRGASASVWYFSISRFSRR